jgi:hypothetical protein
LSSNDRNWRYFPVPVVDIEDRNPHVAEVRGIEDHAPIHDYNLDHRRLRETGFSGWSGANRDRNIQTLATTLMWFETEQVLPAPPSSERNVIILSDGKKRL